MEQKERLSMRHMLQVRRQVRFVATLIIEGLIPRYSGCYRCSSSERRLREGSWEIMGSHDNFNIGLVLSVPRLDESRWCCAVRVIHTAPDGLHIQNTSCTRNRIMIWFTKRKVKRKLQTPLKFPSISSRTGAVRCNFEFNPPVNHQNTPNKHSRRQYISPSTLYYCMKV
jgi:hypothetical protein